MLRRYFFVAWIGQDTAVRCLELPNEMQPQEVRALFSFLKREHRPSTYEIQDTNRQDAIAVLRVHLMEDYAGCPKDYSCGCAVPNRLARIVGVRAND